MDYIPMKKANKKLKSSKIIFIKCEKIGIRKSNFV